jgi:hypothetical protein
MTEGLREAIGIHLLRICATPQARRAVVYRWATAPTAPSFFKTRFFGDKCYVGQVGAFIGVTTKSIGVRRFSLRKRAVYREPRPTI